jgi:hypothetical protein
MAICHAAFSLLACSRSLIESGSASGSAMNPGGLGSDFPRLVNADSLAAAIWSLVIGIAS